MPAGMMRGRRALARAAATVAVAVAAAAAASAAAADAPQPAHAEPYMRVSADDESFGRTFSGAMVVEVVVGDPGIRSTGEPSGEPSVTVGGEPLRMVQGSDGSWYAYFADLEAAMAADAAVARAAGAAGTSMDFGVFCSPGTAAGVLGASFSAADGVAVARAAAGGADGNAPLSECTGPADGGSDVLNNVVRRAPRVSDAGSVPAGQIGIDPAAWPVVQLYSLDDEVEVRYERGGGGETAALAYDEMPGVAMSLDREKYPAGAEVFVTISDAQLGQDPTDRDVWTFSTDPRSPAVFYAGGGGGAGARAVDLAPHLGAMGFEDNGVLTIDAGRTVSFKPNGEQPYSRIAPEGGGGEGGGHEALVTVRETRKSSGVFVSHDSSDESTVWVPRGAPRGTAAVFEYNDRAVSALTGPTTASLGIGPREGAGGGGGGGALAPGTRAPVTVSDADRNANPARIEVLSAGGTGPVPFIRTGSPLTLAGAGGAAWIAADGTAAGAAHEAIDADRIAVALPAGEPAALVIDAGYDAAAVQRQLRMGGAGAAGTAWLNYDIRSLAGPGGTAGATVGIAFGGTAGSPGPAAKTWDASPGRGTVRAPDGYGNAAGGALFIVSMPGGFAEPGPAAGGGAAGAGAAVYLDLFSFGSDGRGVFSNAVYRLELEETSADSGVFGGTVEYVVVDERNAGDPALAASLSAYGDDARIAVAGGGGRWGGDDDMTVVYKDVDGGGGGGAEQVAAEAGTAAHAGSVHMGAQSYRFGRPVTITVVDADLNTDHGRIEAYHVVGDPSSPHADTVAAGGAPLLEVTIKGERYRGCTVGGVEHGGLAASGFALVETGPATGVFEGTFKMPSRICSADGSRLISPAGGKVDARYYDYADEHGNPSIVDASPRTAAPAADAEAAPAAAGGPAAAADAAAGGPAPAADAEAEAADSALRIPAGARQVAMLRGEQMSDAELLGVLRGLIDAGAVKDRPRPDAGSGEEAPVRVPAWFKVPAAWWGDGRVSDAEFASAAQYVLDRGIVSFPG